MPQACDRLALLSGHGMRTATPAVISNSSGVVLLQASTALRGPQAWAPRIRPQALRLLGDWLLTVGRFNRSASFCTLRLLARPLTTFSLLSRLHTHIVPRCLPKRLRVSTIQYSPTLLDCFAFCKLQTALWREGWSPHPSRQRALKAGCESNVVDALPHVLLSSLIRVGSVDLAAGSASCTSTQLNQPLGRRSEA